jgi:hypothetical protein
MKINGGRNVARAVGIVSILVVSLLLLSGCGSTPTPAPTDTPVPPTQEPADTPAPAEPTGEAKATEEKESFQPLDAATCTALADSMAESLGVKLETSDAPFEDYISGQSGTGCQAAASGSGADFGELPDVASKLQKVVEDQGWKQDIKYQADGPSGTSMGFTKGKGLCILSINWKPSDDADCPDDQPLASCDLKPEQKLFTITLNCAQEG